MYKIYADNTLIYDSTIDDYKIGKGTISLELNKSGSFSFSVYPDHFFYDSFVKLKTVITVYKSNRIVFRGRVLNDVVDFWNNKVLTCEGELGFLQDSIIRPYDFSGTPEAFLTKVINEHNAQVDEFKRFKIGTVTVTDSAGNIGRSNKDYTTAFENLQSKLIDESTGGYLFITHEDDGKEETPTLNYLADFTKTATQSIEFGLNLKNYTKTVKAEDIATAIIPLGATIDDGDSETENQRLTIADVNGGVDYVYSEEAVSLYGWIFKTEIWDDIKEAKELKQTALEFIEDVIKQNITLELNAIDLHLLDKSIASINIGDYVHVTSKPHNFDGTLLCSRQSIDIMKPENDSLVLGSTYSTFTETNTKINSSISRLANIQSSVDNLSNRVVSIRENANEAMENYQNINNELGQMSGDMEAIAEAVTQNARNIATNADNIAANAQSIEDIKTRLEALENA